MLKKVAKRIFRRLAGDRRCQQFFERVHGWALTGMHCGEPAAFVERSGEIQAALGVLKKRAGSQQAVCFDVGANRGQYAVCLDEAARALGLPASIYAFEPSAAAFEHLQAEVQQRQAVSAWKIALGESDQRTPLYYNFSGSELASVYPRRLAHLEIALDGSEDVTVRSLDSFCAEHGIAHIHLLKLDAEGHEIAILRGAERLLRERAIDCIQFEFSSCNVDSKTYFLDFWELLGKDFRIYRMVKNGLRLIERYDERREVFVTTNYLAERRDE